MLEVDGKGMLTTVNVIVNIPDDVELAPFTQVTVTEIDEQSLEIVYYGTATTSVFDFEMDDSFGAAFLKANLSVADQASNQLRDVNVNFVWNIAGLEEDVPAKVEGDSIVGKFVKNNHEGVLREMKATGVVQVSDPDVPGHVTTATHSRPRAVIWNSVATGKLVLQQDSLEDLGTDPQLSTESILSEQSTTTAQTTSTGYWSGFWRWEENGWKWIWVWNFGGNSWTVS
jgi:hypothetical protein